MGVPQGGDLAPLLFLIYFQSGVQDISATIDAVYIDLEYSRQGSIEIFLHLW